MLFEIIILSILFALGLFSTGLGRGIAIVMGLTWVFQTTQRRNFKFYTSRTNSKKTCDTALSTFTVIHGIWICCYLYEPGTHPHPSKLIYGNLLYLVSAFVQQFILQSYVLFRLEEILQNKKRAAKSAAAWFALIHIPNPLLMIVTFFWGWYCCTQFQRQKNLYELTICHWLLGSTMATFLPSWVMIAGIGFWRIALQRLTN